MATLVTTLVPSLPSVPAELLLVSSHVGTSHVSDRGVSNSPVSHEKQRITRIEEDKNSLINLTGAAAGLFQKLMAASSMSLQASLDMS